MVNEGKTIKELAREAKQRMKSGFWQDYHKTLEEKVEKGKEEGIETSKIIRYYTEKTQKTIAGVNEQEEIFYNKVKKLLDTEGEVSDAIGRLTDKEYFESLDYDHRQRYILDLSKSYVKAVERYKKEVEFEAK